MGTPQYRPIPPIPRCCRSPITPRLRGRTEVEQPLATAGDDPGVALDLLRRYGPDCRAVRAEWGPQVLEAMRETELRVTGRQLTKRGARSGGAAALVQRLARAGVAEVAIERGDGPVVEAMLAAGVTVVVITPRQVKNLRSRYGAAGNKDDRFDTYVLADVLRTDRARLRPLSRMPGHRRAAAGLPGPQGTWCATGSRQSASCATACWPSFPAQSGSFASFTRRSAWRSWPLRLPGPGR